MSVLAQVAVGAVALMHGYIFVLESVLWTKPFGRRAFGMSVEQAQATAPLALNQGVYNLFLAAGLVFGLWRGATETVLFFLACVAVAGVVGAVTAKRIILFIQTVPAALAAVAVLAG